MAEYKHQCTYEEKKEKLKYFNEFYFNRPNNDYKVSRLPNWINFHQHVQIFKLTSQINNFMWIVITLMKCYKI